MWEWLDGLVQYFSPAKVDSQAQLKAAQNQTFDQRAERLAREKGFRNAQAMIEFERQRGVKRGSTTSQHLSQSVKEGIRTVEVAHPKGVLERVSAALESANNGGK